MAQTSTTTQVSQQVADISKNNVRVSNIVQDDKARKSAPKNVVNNGIKPAE